jgi:hypothetical protein
LTSSASRLEFHSCSDTTADRTVDGRQHRCRLRADALEPADAWLRRYERYWTSRLDALEDLIARSDDR